MASAEFTGRARELHALLYARAPGTGEKIFTAAGAIFAAHEAGIEVALDEKLALKMRGDKAGLTDEIRAALKTHRDEIRRMLLDDMGRYPLDAFAASSHAVLSYSEKLGEHIILAGEKADLAAFCQARGVFERTVAYQGANLLRLLSHRPLTTAALKAIHAVMREFPSASIAAADGEAQCGEVTE